MLKGIIFGSNDVGTFWSEVMESFGGDYTSNSLSPIPEILLFKVYFVKQKYQLL